MSLTFIKVQNHSILIDLNINLENFGPIAKGSMKIKPMTIFIGPNNSGKSYTARLIHSIIHAKNRIREPRMSFGSENRHAIMYKKSRKYLYDEFGSYKNKSHTVPIQASKKIHNMLYSELFSKILETTIRGNFGAPLHKLVRVGQKSAYIKLTNSSDLHIAITKKLHVKANSPIRYKITKSKELSVDEKYTEGHSTILVPDDYNHNRFRHGASIGMINAMCDNLINRKIPRNSFYFPAGRTGILQGHRALSASIINNAQFDVIEKIRIPTLTGMITSFISDIIQMSTKPGSFFELAKELEEEIIKGHIAIKQNSHGMPREITYKTRNYEIPISSASSTVSEIAPLTLYLKYIVQVGDMLIIEEPEAHLHPANQIILAKYIVKMIRAGLNVLITTHSVIMLEELGSYVLASKIKSESKKKIGMDDGCYLESDEVSPYLFAKNGSDKHHIRQIEMSDEYGISQDEFVKINESLYSKFIRIQEALAKN